MEEVSNNATKLEEVKPIESTPNKATSRKKKLIGFLIIILLILCFSATIYFFIKNNGNKVDNNVNPTQEPAPTLTTEPLKSELLDDKYDLIFIENGDIYLSNIDKSEKEVLVNNEFNILEFVLSADKTTIYYTIENTALISSARTMAKNSGKIYDDTTKPIGTHLYSYNINFEKTETIIDFKAPDIAASLEKYSNNQSGIGLGVYSEWRAQGINIIGYTEETNNIVYYRMGLFAYDLTTDKEILVKDDSGRLNGACYPDKFVGSEKYIAVEFGCWESAHQEVYKYEQNAYPKIETGDKFKSVIGSTYLIIYMDSENALVQNVDYNFGPNETNKYSFDSLDFGEFETQKSLIVERDYSYAFQVKENLILIEGDILANNYFITTFGGDKFGVMVDLSDFLENNYIITSLDFLEGNVVFTNNSKDSYIINMQSKEVAKLTGEIAQVMFY